MDSQNWKKPVYLFGIFGNVQFIILATIAMFFYAGGHYNNPSAPGYTFWSNFISDLGLTVAYSGTVNIISQTLLWLSAILWGILGISFFLALPSLFKESRKVIKLS
ncbi:MAG: hypothetical protein ACFFD2_12575, partial [Promethearchaeota archaeon]